MKKYLPTVKIWKPREIFFMKNIFYLLFFVLVLCIFSSAVFADEKHDALKFFNKYVSAANSYDPSIINMYSPNAKIIRQVVKPNGELVDIETDTDTYIKQLKLGQATARLKRYKNTYTNVVPYKLENGYKITSLRQPSGEKYKLKSYMVIQKQPNGKWLIVEEMMQTKVQAFLKYAKN